jgi:hypothetical protein
MASESMELPRPGVDGDGGGDPEREPGLGLLTGLEVEDVGEVGPLQHIATAEDFLQLAALSSAASGSSSTEHQPEIPDLSCHEILSGNELAFLSGEAEETPGESLGVVEIEMIVDDPETLSPPPHPLPTWTAEEPSKAPEASATSPPEEPELPSSTTSVADDRPPPQQPLKPDKKRKRGNGQDEVSSSGRISKTTKKRKDFEKTCEEIQAAALAKFPPRSTLSLQGRRRHHEFCTDHEGERQLKCDIDEGRSCTTGCFIITRTFEPPSDLTAEEKEIWGFPQLDESKEFLHVAMPVRFELPPGPSTVKLDMGFELYVTDVHEAVLMFDGQEAVERGQIKGRIDGGRLMLLSYFSESTHILC